MAGNSLLVQLKFDQETSLQNYWDTIRLIMQDCFEYFTYMLSAYHRRHGSAHLYVG